MPSRFKESLGFIKSMRSEDVYRIKNEDVFNEKFVEGPSFKMQLTANHEQFAEEYPYLPNPFCSGFYDSLYSSFLFIYEIEDILDAIKYDGISFKRAESLMILCSMLSVTSTDAMIDIDDEFCFAKKYSLARDMHVMAKNMYDAMGLVHTFTDQNLPLDEPVTLTKYDEVESRLNCECIRSGIAVLKLFHIFALLQTSPLYSDGVHQIAKKLIQSLREILYDKRIIKVIVDSNVYGGSTKAHKSTRLKIYFAMGNSDRYCIRLDFPHEGEDSIHLNMNEPGHKQSTGLPFTDYEEAFRLCGNKDVFDRFFYYQDDLYWFRHDFAENVKAIGKGNPEQSEMLEEFCHNRAHVEIASSDHDNLRAASDFSEAFAEAMADYENATVYGSTDCDDSGVFQYILFQDYIYDTVIKLRIHEMHINIDGHRINEDGEQKAKIESDLRSLFCKYIEQKFSQDEELKKCCEIEIGLGDFFGSCLDRIERVWK